MIEKIQRTFVCPVNIFQENDSWLLTGDFSKKLSCVMESEVADLAGISENTLQMGTFGKIEPNQMADKVSIQIGFFLIPCVTKNSMFQFLARYSGAVII
ncbi:MAG TPA: hypothetical protein VKE92_15490, partial [Anaerolineales bacterium]|nr:hypothetical protein [Anaerolineales bacterium]